MERDSGSTSVERRDGDYLDDFHTFPGMCTKFDGLRPSSKRVLPSSSSSCVVFTQSARVPMNEVVALFAVVAAGEENGKARVIQDHAHQKVHYSP